MGCPRLRRKLSPTVESDVGNCTPDKPLLGRFLTVRSVKATEVSGGLSVPDSLQLEGEVELAPRFDGRCFVDGFRDTRFPFRPFREIEATSRLPPVRARRCNVR